MSSPRVRELEKKGIVFKIVVSKEDITSRVLLPYECFVCGCKLRSESNAIAHSKNPHHIQQFNRFQQFFNIIPPASFNGRVSLLCKFCDNQPSWEDSKEHTQKHNITSWLKPDNLSHTFFRHYISQHKNVYKCNLCQFLYGSWFHAIDHTKDTRHMQSWNQTSSASAKYSLYENTDPQFNLLISNRIFIGDSSLYHCHVCNLSFSHIESVNTHIESIEHENLIQRYTDDIFEFKTKIPKKMEWIIDSSFFIVMKDKIYCKICDVYFTEISEIEPHVETHKADRETAANNDNEKKDSQEKPNASVTVFSNPKTVPIGECKLQIPPHLHWVVQGHKVLVTPTSLFCTICQKILTNNSAIETHLNKHLQVQWQKSNLPAGYPTGPPASDLSSKDQPSSSSRSTGKTRWNDAPNRKIQTIDLTEDEPPFKGCKLKVPDHLRWVVIDHKIAVNETFLFCPICKKSLNDNASVESHLLQHINLSWQKQNLPAGYPRGPTYVPRAEKNKSFQLSIPNVAGKRNATNSLVTEQTKIQKIDASSKHVFKNVGNSIQILPQNTGATILNVPSTKKMSVDSSVHSPVLTTSVANTSPKKNLNTRPNLVDLMKRSIPSMVANSVQAKTVPKVQILSGNSKTNQQTTTGKNKSTVQPPMNSFPVAKPPAKVHCLNVPQILGKNSNAKQNLVNRGVQETLVNRGVQQTLVNHVGQGNLMNHVGQGNLMNPVGQGTLMNPVGQQILVNRQPLLNFPPSKQINQQPLLNYPNMQINPLNPQTVDQQLENQQMNQQLKNQQMNQQLSNQQINQQLKNQQMNQLLKNQQTLNQQLKNQQTLNQQLKNQQTVNQLKTQQTINPINLPINQQQNNPSNQKPLTNFRPSNQLSKKNLQLTSQSHLFNTSIMTKLHKANYLFFTRNEIYEMSPEKKRKIILSSQLSFFVKYSSEYFIYCVVCEKSTPYNLQNVYEHWCSSQHNEYLTKLEEDDKQFTNYPNQFSCLALSKEFMVDNQSSDLKMFTCCACDEIVPDQDLILQQHFRDEKHVKNVQRFRRHSQEICKDIFPLVESNWYSIEKYSCWPCKKLLSNELPFAEHLESKKHLSVMQAMSDEERDNCYFDSCAVCGFLWFGDGEEYTKHCRQDSIHKDLTRNIEDRIDYMPEEASHLFASLGNVISELMKEVEKVRYDLGKESELIRSLEVAVRRKFPEAKAYPFGSRVTGLGFTESDIDIFLDCGGFYNGNFEQHIDLIDKIHHCLKLDSQAWSVERIIETSRTPIIKVYHSHSQLKCDVSFSNGLSVENTKLLKCYLTAYPQCKEMILFIKKWLVLCQISGSRHITNYAMSWFVIFYLQTRELLPSVASLMKGNPHPKSIFGWPVGSREFTVPTASLSLSTKELLKGFFSFYADFDYRLNVACPLLGEIITKKAFLELNTLPHEMKPYVEVISNESDPEFFRIDSPMCIQDPYDLSHNLTKGVKKVIVNRFRKLCAKSCRLLSS